MTSQTTAMNYDRIDWHTGGDFPKELPSENGATHIGMFLAWAIVRNLESADLRARSGAELDAVRARRMTGRTLLLARCDGRLADADLCDEGNAFARDYYQEVRYGYLRDYAQTLAVGIESVYHVANTWEAFDQLLPLLDRAFHRWKRPRRWWEFWKR